MNPLAAIRLPVGPDLTRALPNSLASDLKPVIPQYELGKLAPTPTLQPAPGPLGPTGSTFESTLGRMVAEVNSKQTVASDAVTGLVTGQNVPLHRAMIAMEEASVSFQLMVEVRNKLLESYQELMRMQV
jgi:flagellar hook-basal body complex protein FliE